MASSSPGYVPVHETLPPSAVRLPLAIPSHDATTSFGSHTTPFVAHGLRVGVGVAVGERVADGVAVGVGAPVKATGGATASARVGRAVGGTTAVEPHAPRPTMAIAVLMMAVSFMAATHSTRTRHSGLHPRKCVESPLWRSMGRLPPPH